MALEKYFPFRSVAGDRKYSAEDWAAYFAQFLSDGVFYNNASNLKVVANDAMKITVNTGAGFVVGRMYVLERKKVLPIETADGVLDRIDRIVLRCDYINRVMGVEVIKGNYSATPTAPELTRNADVYELALADVYVAAGAIEITDANITDQRLNTSLCGIVTGLVEQADTTEIFNQFQAYLEEFKETSEEEFIYWFENVKAVLDEDATGNLLALTKKEEEARKKEIAVERERINALIKMKEGSTTGDAELQDLRVGADGKEYETAGEAVRTQLRNVKGAIEEGFDIETIRVDNHNRYKISEVTFQSRLQDDSEELVSSNGNNVVSGWIPVEYGKFYTCSVEVNGVRDTTSDGKTTTIGRLNVKLTDGSIITNQRNIFMFLSYSKSTIGITLENIVAIQFQTNMPTIDISTADKLKATKIMLVEGDTAEQAYENALNLEYLEGEIVIPDEIVYSLKHDDTKADKKTVKELSDDVSELKQNTEELFDDVSELKQNTEELFDDVSELKQNNSNSVQIKESRKHDRSYIHNERFIRSIANVRDSEKAKEFEITIRNDSGKTIKNAGIVVGLHNTVGITPSNNNLPFQIYDEIFSKPTGFKFFDGDTELPYYIESESDCNYIVDKNIHNDQKTMVVFSDGKIAVYNATEARMQITSNDGETWTNICNEITSRPYRVLLPDSQDNLFVASDDGKKLYKYTSLDGYKAGTEVIDMSDTDTKIGSILAEDSDGNLYIGTYQTIFHCVIRKSTDHGNTWKIVFDVRNCQHVHNIFVNTKITPNEIFIGLDNSSADTVETHVSIDAGETWTKVDVPYGNRDYAFRYAGENFYIGCGERIYLGGSTLYKTTDYKDANAYYPLFDNGQGVRDIINVIGSSDDVLIAGGCVDIATNTEQLFLSEDRGETWKTVLIRPYHEKQSAAGAGLRTLSRKEGEIISETSTGYAMRFVYGNGAKTILAIVNVGDIPTSGKTLTLKTGYVANVEEMEKVLTAYENIDGKVADIHICAGYVVDKVSNKRVLTNETELCNYNTKLGQTSEYKILNERSYRLNGSVNLGNLNRLNFTKGFTVSFLFRKEKSLTEYLNDLTHHVIFQSGNIKLCLYRRSIVLMHGDTEIFGQKLYVKDPYLNSVNEDYVRITAYFTNDDLPIARIYTENSWTIDDVTCAEYPITENLSENDFIVGSSDMPNISRIEIYNRVLTHGEIMSLTNGCNLITDGSTYN